ncbi:RNA dependent RNA polymerase-domain-containing protein [Apiosordaria backusii]|uniref:RNA-dependent RNA polymerase n=1 Tax=Apiosordaria backusii TaxID=314023 RepID=A0AA40EXC4_9PEZI|nr:RNA dependent RNA polymerase-domain-containing protein [Apiosordaria backusii]
MPMSITNNKPGVPATPSKNDKINDTIVGLNLMYGLNIQRSTVSPTRNTNGHEAEEAARHRRIVVALNFLWYKDTKALEQVLHEFYYQAKTASQQWVPKPRADPTTLPSSQDPPPKAFQPQERAQLEQILLELLTQRQSTLLKAQTLTPAASRSFTRSRSDAAATPGRYQAGYDVRPESPSSGGSAKRRSDDEDDPTRISKKRRDQSFVPPSLGRSTSTPISAVPFSKILDTVPTRQRLNGRAISETTRTANPSKPTDPSQQTSFDAGQSSTYHNTNQSSIFSHPTVVPDHQSTRTSQYRSIEKQEADGRDVITMTVPLRPSQNNPPRLPQVSSFSNLTSTQQSASVSHGQLPVQRRDATARLLFPPSNGPSRTASPATAPPEVIDLTSNDLDSDFSDDIRDAVEAEYEMERLGARLQPTPTHTPYKPVGPPPPLRQQQQQQQQQQQEQQLPPRQQVTKPPRAPKAALANLATIRARLENIWPRFPLWLQDAPLAVAWEVTRILHHCKVDPDDESLVYQPEWATSDIADIRNSLCRLDIFRGKTFPERPPSDVFAAALNNFELNGSVVLMSISLDFNPDKDRQAPLFLVDMKPLRLDQGCRLTRRFGADRFFEVLVASPTASSAPDLIKNAEPHGAEEVIKWITGRAHALVGRHWRAFFAKDAGFRKPIKEYSLAPEEKTKVVSKERLHFFAETGINFCRSEGVPPWDEPMGRRTECRVSQMLNWLLELHRPKNQSQPHLKLFSRIQLGLSKTFPTVVFHPSQIVVQKEDILSPIGKLMNDGIGRMSRTVARRIRDIMGLTEIPSAVQGRIGPAKGMWLMDVSDTSDKVWIETYPSQRKWECDPETVDIHQRTLEIRAYATELKSAGLNLQFLPVLEDRAQDKALMKRAIGARLTNDLKKEFDDQKAAFKHPLLLRQWLHENWSGRADRVKNGEVAFMGGLPDKKEEILHLLLNGGFDPMQQKYIQDIAWELQKQKCDNLSTKLNIKVGRSAYIYMVVDFWGVLEEGEVHVGFSSKFRDDADDTSYTLLSDCDVLVARSPAHFASDVQRVRAVFKPELHALKDVIVFSAKGNIPLADKLSGGDYDGDMAWVCWDPLIVGNFVNAEVPEEPDLSAYLGKDKTTFADLMHESGQQNTDRAVYDMIEKSFQFSMQPNFLGMCTNYKEKLCYHNNSVSDGAAVLLSSLVGKLVDQSKQGILFDKSSWERLRKDVFGPQNMQPPDPAYKGDHWSGQDEARHIIDYLKFFIAKPAISREMEALDKLINSRGSDSLSNGNSAAHYWDPDLANYFKSFEEVAVGSRTIRGILQWLKNDIAQSEKEWKTRMAKAKTRHSKLSYPETVTQVYEGWNAIQPRTSETTPLRLDPKTALLFGGNGPYDPWNLLKASATFKQCYKTAPKFAWIMAGRQLAYIKALSAGSSHAPLLVTPLMYAGLNADGKFVKQFVARLEHDGTQYGEMEERDSDWDEE